MTSIRQKLIDRSTNVIQFTHEQDVERWKGRFEAMSFSHCFGHYTGDWGFNYGTIKLHIDDARGEDGEPSSFAHLYLVHNCHEMQPFYRTPEFLEFQTVEHLSLKELRAFSDALVEYLDKREKDLAPIA